MTNYHVTRQHEADLDTAFGMDLAISKLQLNQTEIEALLGRYVKGKNKGKLKGCLVWLKTTEGGWDRGSQSVVLPGSSGYRLCSKVWVEGCYAYITVATEQEAVEVPVVKVLRKYLVNGTTAYESDLEYIGDVAQEYNKLTGDRVRLSDITLVA